MNIETARRLGAQRSSYLHPREDRTPVREFRPQLDVYKAHIRPVLEKKCFACHGEDEQEADLRIDRLDPNLVAGDDVAHWVEVLDVVTNDEMPPSGETDLTDDERRAILDWLSNEVHVASRVRRAEAGHTSFRRMTRYELRYALQDLLGVPLDFARDLPPEAISKDGFENSSEHLHVSPAQLETYRDVARKALDLVTVPVTERGSGPPVRLRWSVSMADAAAREFEKQDRGLESLEKKLRDEYAKQQAKRDAKPEARPEQIDAKAQLVETPAQFEARLGQELAKRRSSFVAGRDAARYVDRNSGREARVEWAYNEARFAWEPVHEEPSGNAVHRDAPQDLAPDSMRSEAARVAILPPGRDLIVELGDRLPSRGTMRVRVHVAKASAGSPSLALEFGWQASNDSRASVLVSEVEHEVLGADVHEWDVHLSDVYPRNMVRGTAKMGETPSPSEFIKIINRAVARGTVEVERVEVIAPVHDVWPPESHTRIFFDQDFDAARASDPEHARYAREIFGRFLPRAWRRPVTDLEVEQKVSLYERLRSQGADFQDSVLEVLATALASPKFLYLGRGTSHGSDNARCSDYELASRLAIFLWCSIPDEELLALAARGTLQDETVLRAQVDRMLRDARHRRFSRHFVRQWLGMRLLDYYEPDKKAHPGFPRELKEAMEREPIAFFDEMLRVDASVLDFLHADYAMVNERLARHYGIEGVLGNRLRRVGLQPEHRRGGLLVQAGLLAMNSDGRDSHPLKRGIWLLERLLADPPAPPPPNVPKIDLADPEIAKLTLKQRIERHRDQPACMSCHSKIDPWGIAFENYDAVGRWRDEIQGKAVDASSVLFNKQRLDGMDGLKRFLLLARQDQFVHALVEKLASYALGRPLRLQDRARIDEIAGDVRKKGDGLVTMLHDLVCSELFRER
ncbi:MAG: DUF1592 domain-containing protein [Planctomycetes bacterium]|nr:DUF1592 domain-containing protein [Planctomycetota bacterium]MCB9920173.1 DUF1592 domain-containing protein [Planctomycetota bacterium]